MMLPPIVFVADNSVHLAFESFVQELELLPLLFIPFNLPYVLSILVVCISIAAEKDSGRCMPKCGGKRTEPGYMNNTCD